MEMLTKLRPMICIAGLIICCLCLGQCKLVPAKCLDRYSEWRSDTLACQNNRAFLLEPTEIDHLRDCLVGEDVTNVNETLGAPNTTTTKTKTILYVYYILPGGQCITGQTVDSDSPRLIVSIENEVESIDIVYP